MTGPALDSSSLRDSQAEALPERPITAPAQLADISYGRRQVTVRKRNDHPRGARGKSRTERVVDLHDPRTLDAVRRRNGSGYRSTSSTGSSSVIKKWGRWLPSHMEGDTGRLWMRPVGDSSARSSPRRRI